MTDFLNILPLQKFEQAQTFIKASQNVQPAPLIVKILMALGAYFAATFILSSMFPLFLLFRDLIILLAYPIIALIIYLSKRVKIQSEAMQIFWENMLLFLMLSAKVALFWGIIRNSHYGMNTIFLAALAINAIVYPLFNNSADRFIGIFLTASIAFAAPLTMSLNPQYSFFLWKFISPDIVISLIFGAAILIFIKGKKALFPLAYALICATVFNLSNYISTTSMAQFFQMQNIPPPSFLSSMFSPQKLLAWAFALIALYYHYKQNKTQPNIRAILITSLICLPLNPGCIMGLAFLLIAKYTFNTKLLNFSYIIFAASLSLFYYNLDTTLMQKSGLLILSGLVLLGLLRRAKNAA